MGYVKLMMLLRSRIVKYLTGNITEVYCKDCKKEGAPKKEVSVLNLGFYLILAIVAYFVFKYFNFGLRLLWSFLVFMILTFLDAKLSKPKCGFCRSYDIVDASSKPCDSDCRATTNNDQE